MDELLSKVKANLILEHTADDALLKSYITAAVSYAESYQHIPEGFYKENPMPPTTEQAVIMLSSHFYESRDGSTGGFFADNTGAAQEHGSQRWANLAAFSEATDLFRFRCIPGLTVTTDHFLIYDDCRYDIVSVEDVKGRGMYIEVLAKKEVPTVG